MLPRLINTLLLVTIISLFTGCNTTTVKTTQHEPINKGTSVPEDQLLDVGINLFDPGLNDEESIPEGVYPNVRKAEARYMPFRLMETLQSSGNWGAVRVIPNRQSEMDVWVDAEII